MKQVSFFEQENIESEPLAARMRPRDIDEFVGQKHLIGEGKVLRRMIESDRVSSMIFWGPPGVGKTTLAQIIASRTNAQFITFSAVTSGIKEIKNVMQQADRMASLGSKTIVFIDEIHRFNKAQQDAFLPFVEKGSIVLIGATTENPSFEVNGALISRCRVFVLQQLKKDEIADLLRRAVELPRGFGSMNVEISDELLNVIAGFSNGDARSALSILEMVVLNGDSSLDEGGCEKITVTEEIVEQCTSKKSLMYDKSGEEHYNLISALHKSVRNSDVNAAIYWLARMLEAGEDPKYVARRVTRMAAEDIGLADPRAMEICVAAFQAVNLIGMPECSVHLTQAVTYLALAPKSNAMETAYFAARDDALKELSEPVPMNIRNAPTGLMKDLGYGDGYIYAHDTEDKIASMQCLPDNLVGREYYKPGNQGLEPRFAERYEAIKEWHRKHDR